MKKILIAVLISFLTTVAAWGQSPATARIQVLAVPEENTTLEIGPPEATVIYEFAPSDPQNGNVWVDTTAGFIPCPEVTCVLQEFVDRFETRLQAHASAMDVTFTRSGNQFFFETVTTGAATNQYVLISTTDAICLAFCGGSDR